MTNVHAFKSGRHETRVSVIAGEHSCLLSVSGPGLDLTAYLNPGDLAILAANIDKALAELAAQKVLLRASVEQMEVV